MWRVLKARLHQKRRTAAYPAEPPVLPGRFRGLPELRPAAGESLARARAVCPTGALAAEPDGAPRLDMGACLFCGLCQETAGAQGGVTLTREHRLCARRREHLMLRPGSVFPRAEPLAEDLRRLLGRSLKLREVSAGGCNACEADTNVLTTLVFDLGRFGIQFVASPRHADGLFITGPVTRNMAQALRKTYDAVPAPKIVIACGACAVAGGPYAGQAEILGGADAVVPVDLYIPGCPPHPYTILDGLLRLLGRIP
jgi:Ni,Fe-hydrogenase III small subunit